MLNLTGHPAMSVLSGLDGNGLPVGAQFGAAIGEETVPLRMAGQLEQSNPWPSPH